MSAQEKKSSGHPIPQEFEFKTPEGDPLEGATLQYWPYGDYYYFALYRNGEPIKHDPIRYKKSGIERILSINSKLFKHVQDYLIFPKEAMYDCANFVSWNLQELLEELSKPPPDDEYLDLQQQDVNLPSKLKDPTLFLQLEEELQQIGVVKENKLTMMGLFIGLSAYLSEHQRLNQVNHVPTSSVGKDFPIKAIIAHFPPNDVIDLTRITPTFLDNWQTSWNNKILVLYDHEFQKEKGTESSLKDRIIRVLLTEGIALGTVEDREAVIHKNSGKPALLMSTIMKVEFQLNTRVWLGEPHLSLEKIEGVIDQQSARGEEGDPEIIRSPILIQLIEWFKMNVKPVVIPFLKAIIGEKIKAVYQTCKLPRIMRDYPKLQTLIRIIANMMQEQRQLTDDGKILAQLEDYLIAIHYAQNMLASSMSDLSEKECEIYRTCAEKWGVEANEKTGLFSDFKVKEVATERNEHVNTVRPILKSLVKKGMIYGEKEEKKGWKFWFTKSMDPENTARHDVLSSLLLSKNDVKNGIIAYLTRARGGCAATLLQSYQQVEKIYNTPPSCLRALQTELPNIPKNNLIIKQDTLCPTVSSEESEMELFEDDFTGLNKECTGCGISFPVDLLQLKPDNSHGRYCPNCITKLTPPEEVYHY